MTAEPHRSLDREVLLRDTQPEILEYCRQDVDIGEFYEEFKK